MSSLDKVQVEIAAVIGSRNLPVSTLLTLGRGARLRLDDANVESVEILAGRIAVGRARLVLGRDARLAIEIVDVFRKPERVNPDTGPAAT